MPDESKHWYEPLTPLSFLERIAVVMPEKVAVIDEHKIWTWMNIFQKEFFHF
jgi:hypothetical protein